MRYEFIYFFTLERCVCLGDCVFCWLLEFSTHVFINGTWVFDQNWIIDLAYGLIWNGKFMYQNVISATISFAYVSTYFLYKNPRFLRNPFDYFYLEILRLFVQKLFSIVSHYRLS